MKFRPLVTQWLVAQLAIALVAIAQRNKVLHRPGCYATKQPQHDLAAVMRFALDLNVEVDPVGDLRQLSGGREKMAYDLSEQMNE